MEDKPRCQAILLMPKSRSWAKYCHEGMRCKFSAKPENAFCGVHAKLGEVIHSIIWKEV